MAATAGWLGAGAGPDLAIAHAGDDRIHGNRGADVPVRAGDHETLVPGADADDGAASIILE